MSEQIFQIFAQIRWSVRSSTCLARRMKLAFSSVAILIVGAASLATTPVAATTPMVSAGVGHTLFVRSDGRFFAWGGNANGQLGDGTTIQRTEPVTVSLPGGVSAVAIAAGVSHSLALGSDGKVYAWGGNSCGKLGTGVPRNAFRQY